MRKLFIPIILLFSFFLSGCSLLGEVNSTLQYVNKATEHINKWQDFGQVAPQMVKDAAINAEAKNELEAELKSLSDAIDEFNETEPPAIAKGVHQQLVEKNEEIKHVIENSMINGELTLEKLQDSELFTLINEVTTMMNLLEELGQ
ncbi:DUF6376 family protein [Sutcliffiella rhizosphaerae]|uniref:Lipoprotein n=1 Tax=Sutcliffiella rhizosphaerae TaxID=2880967 RepID=A0ABM8YPM0_9BACI|nr:DUF6376 family protein [Sutcliffiella rhizosphaerae]CAG9621745.1 hypothetical protein BACCIP111883_02518 [Sutcliffiella rhizosphaerae]